MRCGSEVAPTEGLGKWDRACELDRPNGRPEEDSDNPQVVVDLCW